MSLALFLLVILYMAKSSDKIEQAAVTCIIDAFYDSERLTPHIPLGDKEPVWDGNIYIKHGNKGTSRIPAQVKGKTVKKLPKKFSYPISLVNLENYKRDGGVVYFVVYQVDGQKIPYFRFLTPIELKRFIKLANGKKETSIPLEPFGKVAGDLENRFIQFYYDCKKQTSFSNLDVLELKEALSKQYKLTYQVHGAKSEIEAMKYVMSHETYLYANIGVGENTVMYPVGDQPLLLFFLPLINKTVSCGGHVYFTQYNEGANNERREVHIDGFLRMVRFKDKETSLLNMTPDKGNLEKFYNQISFIHAVSKEGCFYLGDERIDVNGIKEDEIRDIEFQYEYWKRAIITLQALNCNLSKINISSFTDSDFGNLSLLSRAILDCEEVCQTQELDVVTTMQLGPYRVLLKTEKLNNGKYRISDFFKMRRDNVFAMEGDNQEKFAVSIFTIVFQRDDFDSIINIDYDNFIKSYEDVAKFSRDISSIANGDVLRMIDRYDKSKFKDQRLLDNALQLTDWITALPEKDNLTFVYRLNRLQIIKRLKGGFTQDQSEELIEISESDIPAFGKWAANLLLEDYNRADRFWSRMTEDERQSYIHYPIYYFQANRKQS